MHGNFGGCGINPFYPIGYAPGMKGGLGPHCQLSPRSVPGEVMGQ